MSALIDAPAAQAAVAQSLSQKARAARGRHAPRATLKRDTAYRRLLMLADLLAVLIALNATVLLGHGSHLTPQAVVLLSLLAPAAAKLGGLYDRDAARLRKSTLDEAPSLVQLAISVAFITWLLSKPLLGLALRPEQALAELGTLTLGLLCARTAARQIVTGFAPPERCLYLGSVDGAKEFAEKLSRDRASSATIIGQLGMGEAESLSLADVEALRDLEGIQRVVIAPETSSTHLIELTRTFEVLGIRVTVMPAVLSVIGSAVEFDDVSGTALLSLRPFNLTRSSVIVKRAFDFLGASLLLLLLSPLMVAISMAVRFSSPGGVLFRQLRVGRQGQLFTVYKFRTMFKDAEGQRADLMSLNEAAEGFFKIADDPRVTTVGRWLRKTSLDELPQLLNVIRGEMSLVGPRPLVPEEDARVTGWNRRRLELTPGMTGPWQVLGSSRVPLREMVTLDYLYVGNWSLWTDIKIIVRTVSHVTLCRTQ